MKRLLKRTFKQEYDFTDFYFLLTSPVILFNDVDGFFSKLKTLTSPLKSSAIEKLFGFLLLSSEHKVASSINFDVTTKIKNIKVRKSRILSNSIKIK